MKLIILDHNKYHLTFILHDNDSVLFFSDCWEIKTGYNAMAGLLTSPRAEDRPKVLFFGPTTNITWCKEQCAMEPFCYAYTWASGSTKWSNLCYGRGFGAAEALAKQGIATTGIKIC